MSAVESSVSDVTQKLTNGSGWSAANCWDYIMDYLYGLPIGHFLISFIYLIHAQLTIVNLIKLFLKYIPTTYFGYKFLKAFYGKLRERRKPKQLELEDLQLQLEDLKTKVSVRADEITKFKEQLHEAKDSLRKVREKVHEIIATSDELQRVYAEFICCPSHDLNSATTSKQEQEFVLELLEDLKYDRPMLPELHADKLDSGEHTTPTTNSENNAYSTARKHQQDCQVKIVKITSVYKVAYLRHFIKQKKLRRATKQAMLKQKMENIKKLLEDWQRTLNTVINNKLAILDIDSNRIEVASQEAMDDYSNPQYRESSESDSQLSWNQNPDKNCTYCYEDPPEASMPREYYLPHKYNDVRMQSQENQHNCSEPMMLNELFTVKEETSSQVFEEFAGKSEAGDEWDCRDIL